MGFSALLSGPCGLGFRDEPMEMTLLGSEDLVLTYRKTCTLKTKNTAQSKGPETLLEHQNRTSRCLNKTLSPAHPTPKVGNPKKKRETRQTPRGEDQKTRKLMDSHGSRQTILHPKPYTLNHPSIKWAGQWQRRNEVPKTCKSCKTRPSKKPN